MCGCRGRFFRPPGAPGLESPSSVPQSVLGRTPKNMVYLYSEYEPRAPASVAPRGPRALRSPSAVPECLVGLPRIWFIYIPSMNYSPLCESMNYSPLCVGRRTIATWSCRLSLRRRQQPIFWGSLLKLCAVRLQCRLQNIEKHTVHRAREENGPPGRFGVPQLQACACTINQLKRVGLFCFPTKHSTHTRP
jgi:hypothetical protein